MGMSSALIPTGDLALPPKPTQAAMGSQARLTIDEFNVGMMSESRSFSVS